MMGWERFQHIRVIKPLNNEVNTVSKKILLLAKEDEIAKLLMTIPGVGYYSALLIVSEVGEINKKGVTLAAV